MSLEACTLVNSIVGSPNLCSGVVEYASGYAYNVTLWTAALFTALFALVAIAHLGQAIRGRRWFMLATVFICCLTELLGWSARLWSAISTKWSPENGGQWTSAETAFLMQISTLIFAPAFLAAGWYIMLGKLISLLGPQDDRFNPFTYAIVFLLGDAASLVTQAVGGGLAAGSETEADARMGANIMLGGVCAQMFVTVLFCLLLAETLVRYFRNKPVTPFRFRRTKPQNDVPRGTVDAATERKAKTLVGAMVFSTTLIFVRSIYRVAELSEGWSEPIISNELLFCVLDATMVFLAVLVFNFIHPMWFLPRGQTAIFSTGTTESGGRMVRRSSSQTVVGENIEHGKETV